jgi:hypothetical protein
MTLKNTPHGRKLGTFETIDQAVAALFDWRLTGEFRLGRLTITVRRVNTAMVARCGRQSWGHVMTQGVAR